MILYRGDKSYFRLVVMALVSLGVYVVGIPVLFAGCLWSYRQIIHEPKVKFWLQNLYYCYKRKVFWFELLILMRRLGLAAIISTLPQGSLVLPFLIMLVLLSALMLQMWVKPFASKVDNYLETFSIAVMTITFVVQNLTVGDDTQDMWELSNTQHDGLALVLVIGNLALVLVLVAILLWPLLKWIAINTRSLFKGSSGHDGFHQVTYFLLPSVPK